MEVEINDRAYFHDLLEVFLQIRRINLSILFQTFTLIFFGNVLKVFKHLWNDDRNMSDILELFQHFIFFLVTLLVIFVVNPFLLDHVTNVLDGTRFKPVAHFVDIGQPFPVTIQLFYARRNKSVSFEVLPSPGFRSAKAKTCWENFRSLFPPMKVSKSRLLANGGSWASMLGSLIWKRFLPKWSFCRRHRVALSCQPRLISLLKYL